MTAKARAAKKPAGVKKRAPAGAAAAGKAASRRVVPAAPLRIAGVVKAMNLARQRLGAGLAPGEEADFWRWVRATVAQVEQLCRQHLTRPECLPAPTYRAYQVLKELQPGADMPPATREAPASALKARSTPAAAQAGQHLRVANLIAACRGVQQQLSELATQPAPVTWSSPAGPVLEQIQELTTSVERICGATPHGPSALPAPSQRAYRWLKFLSQPENLHAHLASLATALQIGRLAVCRQGLPARQHLWPVHVEFYNLPALYRLNPTGGAFRVTASEGFVGAPGSVIEALVCSAVSSARLPYLGVLRQYAAGPAFTRLVRSLELDHSAHLPSRRGHYFDLDDVFERVNGTYFEGRLPRPHLAWNKTITQRKLGHYQPASDTVIISISLDRLHVPDYVLDFVMYHELLHKQLGIQVVNGRRYAHTPHFKAAERQFQQYGEAQAFLKQFGQDLI